MEGKSQTEQEKDIRELLRRADRTPSRTSSQRKEALRRLIELAHSPYPNLKVIAATNLRHFIKDFPELEDDAINAVYDLCEDPVTQVRIKGYAAIVDVSREQNKWVKRNADVLVQLLQSDEPEEVTFVKRALTQHLDMDPAVTLGVLCDQIIPSDEPMDEEERAIRDRLRSLVLTFITTEAKHAIVERHTSAADSPAEEVLTSGLFKAVTQLPPSDLDVIVKNILLSMSSFKLLSPRGKQLLDIVLDRARASLKIDLQPGHENSSLEHTRHYLELASFVAVDRRVANPSHLLRFYITSLMSKMTLLRLNQDAQIFVISNIANTLAACEEAERAAESADADESALLRKQVTDSSVVLFQLFAEAKFVDRGVWRACLLLLRACANRKSESKWDVPTHLWASVNNIQALANAQPQGSVDSMEEIHALIRSILESPTKPAVPPPAPAPAAITDVSKEKGMSSSVAATKGDRRIMNVKRKLEAALPPRPPSSAGIGPSRTGPATTSTPQRTDRARVTPPQARARASTAPGGAATNGHTAGSDEARAAKRAKKGGGGDDDMPSLLSRLAGAAGAATNGNGKAVAERVPHKIPPKPRMDVAMPYPRQPRAPPPDPRAPPVPAGGWSIRGAAKAAERSPPSDMGHSSLLDRLQSSDDWEGGRKKRRTKT